MDLTTIILNLLIGFGFGFSLERAGFGDSRKLAAQFYFYDQTVLKVMFTAIIWCMVLLFWCAALGWVDFDQIFVNPTHVWTGIVGGFLIGAGFIVGGYCPGTSVVASSTGKLDGVFFLGGILGGIVVFQMTAASFQTFFDKLGDYGRITVFDWLGIDAGLVVLGVVLAAVGAFTCAEFLEKAFRRLLGMEVRS